MRSLRIAGRRFYRLQAVMPIAQDKDGKLIWLFLCDCGKTKACRERNVRNGHTKSCGCLRKVAGISPKSSSVEYRAYMAAKSRCRGERNYKTRGIQFRFDSFDQFLKEVGLRPDPSRSLDRKNNDGHYEPGNVRWATKSEQVKNRRRMLSIENYSDAVLIAEVKRRGL